MPTYVYECSVCAKVFEAEQRITEDPLKDCHCGGQGTLKRLIQPIAVMFKGSGFHINDYNASNKTGDSSESSGKPADTPAEKKVEAEPATPPPTPTETTKSD